MTSVSTECAGSDAALSRTVHGNQRRLEQEATCTPAGPRGTDKHRLLKLESRSGEQIIVDMGPSRSPSTMGFRQGDLIVAMGKSARINGRPVLYAHYVGELQDLAAAPLSGGRRNVNGRACRTTGECSTSG